jgi:hypothetical protein
MHCKLSSSSLLIALITILTIIVGNRTIHANSTRRLDLSDYYGSESNLPNSNFNYQPHESVAAAAASSEDFSSLYETVDYNRRDNQLKFILNSNRQDDVENNENNNEIIDRDSYARRLVKRQTIEANNVLLRSQAIKTSEDDHTNGVCVYSNIRSKIMSCFQTSMNDCK